MTNGFQTFFTSGDIGAHSVELHRRDVSVRPFVSYMEFVTYDGHRETGQRRMLYSYALSGLAISAPTKIPAGQQQQRGRGQKKVGHPCQQQQLQERRNRQRQQLCDCVNP